MMDDGLPNTMTGLRQLLERGCLTLDEACHKQRARFSAGAQRFGGVVRFLDETSPEGLFYSGIGVAHKDIFSQEGFAPGLGRDTGTAQAGGTLARAPAALRAQGMFQMGTVSMAEDACSATAYTRNLPTPLNPFDPSLAVGGSSSGSGVVVAAGMAYASLGTDTAGSVRIPAMTCGVMGLKTTHGLINRQGMLLLSPSLDSIGVLARSVSDLDHVLGLLTHNLVHAVPQEPRLAYWDGFEAAGSGARPEVMQIVRDFFARYARAVKADVGTHFERASHHVQVIMNTEVARSQKARIEADLASPEARTLGLLGKAMPAELYHQSVVQRGPAVRRFVDEVMAGIDVLLLPLQIQSLPETEEVYPGGQAFSVSASLAMHRMCGWINYLGLPALAIPIGCDTKGRPVSIQLVARPRQEKMLLQVGQRLQDDLYGHDGIVPSV